MDFESIPPPPPAGSKGDPAARRLAALRALDDLNGVLERAPAHAEVHYRLGKVYLFSLENPGAAAAHLCRALIEAPDVDEYRLTLLAAWMARGNEQELELALRSSEQSLPWRGALEEARELSGVTEVERAHAFEEALRSQRIVRATRALPQRRTAASIRDPAALLRAWASNGPPDTLRIVVSFSAGLRGRVATLRHRGSETQKPVFQTVGPYSRWLLYGHSTGVVEDVLSVVRARLRGKRIGISMEQQGRRVCLTGVLRETGFVVDTYADAPDDHDMRVALGLSRARGAQ